QFLQKIDVSKLVLWKPRDAIPITPSQGLVSRIKENYPGASLSQFAYQLEDVGRLVADVFQNQIPPFGCLHIIVSLPAGAQTGAIVASSSDTFINSDLVKGYEDFFITVERWGAFGSSDIGLNNIRKCHTPVPGYVTKLEQELQRKPGLAPDVCYFLDYS
ncbi:hypothetical protein BJV74DRAFT_849924, partial [Russula compacta]